MFDFIPFNFAHNRKTDFSLIRTNGFSTVKVAVILALISTLGGLAMLNPFAAATGSATVDTDWYVVKQIDFDIIVTAKGELDAASQVEIRNQLESWQAKIVDVVEEGAAVKKDDIIVKLADDQIKQAHDQQALEVKAAEAKVTEARKQVEIQKIESESLLRTAKVKLELAELDLKKWRNGEMISEKQKLELAMEEATSQHETALRDWIYSQKLFSEKFISQNEHEADRLNLLKAEQSLKNAKLDLAIFEDYKKPRETRRYESDYEQAKADMTKAQREAESKTASTDQTLVNLQRQLQMQRSQLEHYQRQVAAMTIRAPADGTLIYASTLGRGRRFNSDPIAVGRQVYMNESIAFLPDLREMVGNIMVHEVMIASVKKGDSATIIVEAVEGIQLSGTVDRISQAPSIGNYVNPDIREYQVRIQLDIPGDIEFRPGMRCTAKIKTATVKNVLAVPVQCVFAQENQHYVYVQNPDGLPKKQAVTINRASEIMVEITDGLKENDRVILRDVKPGEVIE